MPPLSIHQAIHGYRDGHRLLSSSISLNTESSWAMLVLSDLSGPAIQPGFDEYLTGYPLLGTDYFVFAKTWYAPEMQRPGCVWTHSLLVAREDVPKVSTASLLASFQRPKQEGVENAASGSMILDAGPRVHPKPDYLADRATAGALISAVFGQVGPVIVPVDNAAQLEPLILGIWNELWPSAKSDFSFCTGALIPRSVSGVLMSLQAVPRVIPSSHFRRSAGAALIVDLRTPASFDPWVAIILETASSGNNAFRSWIETAAGAESPRDIVPSLIPIFDQWNSENWSGPIVLSAVLGSSNLSPATQTRLVRMVFDRTASLEGFNHLRELLQILCRYRDTTLPSVTPLAEEHTRKLFEYSRTEGCSLILSLLGAELTALGECVLRTALLLLVPEDLEGFGDALRSFLPTIVTTNPVLAVSPTLWKEVGSRASEVLSHLSGADFTGNERSLVVDAVLSSGCDVPAEALIQFGGRTAIFTALEGLSTGRLMFSWQWRSILSAHPDLVIEWLEDHQSLSQRELNLGSKLLSPKTDLSRLAKIWLRGISGANSCSSRVAAFGLALSLAEENSYSPLLALCFQPTYEALSNSQIEFDEWEWLRDFAPPLSWWKEWDKCERIALALAQLIANQRASLETIFGIVHTPHAVRKVASLLHENKATRTYLKSLRKTASESTQFGTRDQREALLKDW